MDELKEYQNSCMELMILKFKQELDTQVSKEVHPNLFSLFDFILLFVQRGAAGAFEQENKRLTAELVVANGERCEAFYRAL